MTKTKKKPQEVFTAEQKAAMRQYAKEQKAREAGAADAEMCEAAIKEMTGTDREIGERVHAIVKAAAPQLAARTWYGMPAYAKGKDIICFFQPAAKFKARYCTLGFNDKAALDEGNLWATSFALTKIGTAEEKRIRELVKQAAS